MSQLTWRAVMELPVPPEDISWRGQGKAFQWNGEWHAVFVPYITRTVATQRIFAALGAGGQFSVEPLNTTAAGTGNQRTVTVTARIRVVVPSGGDFTFIEVGQSTGQDADKGAWSDLWKRVASALGTNQTYRMDSTIASVVVKDPKDPKKYRITSESKDKLYRVAISAYNHQRDRWEQEWGELCPLPALGASGRPVARVEEGTTDEPLSSSADEQPQKADAPWHTRGHLIFLLVAAHLFSDAKAAIAGLADMEATGKIKADMTDDEVLAIVQAEKGEQAGEEHANPEDTVKEAPSYPTSPRPWKAEDLVQAFHAAVASWNGSTVNPANLGYALAVLKGQAGEVGPFLKEVFGVQKASDLTQAQMAALVRYIKPLRRGEQVLSANKYLADEVKGVLGKGGE